MKPLILLFAVSCASLNLSAQSIEAGKQVALQCQACHGMDGMAKMPETPHLSGQPSSYLSKSLTDFKSKKRQHEVMTVMAGMLNDKQIADVAAWYASQEIVLKAANK
jgi:cytochrome c553